MKKTARLISILLCVALLATLLAACAGQSSSAAAGSSAAGSSAAPAADANLIYDGSAPVVKEQETISWICGAGGSDINFDDFSAMKWCNQIAINANINLDLECIDGASYADNIKPRLAAGTDLPDVVLIPGKDQDMTYCSSGIFVELTDLYEKYGFNLNWRFESNPTVRAQSTTPDGKIYYVPGINMSVDYCPAMLYCIPVVEDLGLEIPETTDDYYTFLQAIKAGDPEQVPYFAQTGYIKACFASFWGLDLGNGYYAEDDGTVTASYTSERYLDFLTYMKKLYDEGLLNADFASVSSDTCNQMVANHQISTIGHYLNYCHSFSKLYDPEWDTVNGDLIYTAWAEPMTGPFGHKEYKGNDAVFGFWGISRDCEKPEVAFAFMDYIYSEEANLLMYFGIEGEDYVKNDDGTYTLDLEKRTKDNYSVRMGNNFGGFCRILLAMHRDNSYNHNIADLNSHLRDFYYVPIGSMFCLDNETETISSYSTDLSTAWNEAFLAFITGTRPLSDWDTYVSELEGMHLEDVRTVYAAHNERLG